MHLVKVARLLDNLALFSVSGLKESW